jgi:hypothetical protein
VVHMDQLTLTPTHIAEAVRDALAASGLGVNEAADAARVPRTTFKRHLENGNFDSFELVRVAHALGTTASAIYASAERRAA